MGATVCSPELSQAIFFLQLVGEPPHPLLCIATSSAQGNSAESWALPFPWDTFTAVF